MHGYALGMAMDVCSAADMRICSKDTVFCVKEVDIGIASDIGILARLPKVVGSYTWVKDVAMSGRNFNADEALRVGFVSTVLPTKNGVMEEAFRVARNLSGKSPVAVQTIKHFLDYSRDRTVAEGTSYICVQVLERDRVLILNSGLQYQLAYNVAAVQTKDVPVAISSMLSKEKPVFGKL